MARYINAVLGGLAVITGLLVTPAGATGPVNVNYSISGGDSAIVNGWWDGTNDHADSAGELTCHIAGVWSGVPGSLLTLADDTIIVDKGFAMSSLAALNVPDDTSNNTPYDTIYFRYIVQNQGNVTDSIFVEANLHDTSDAVSFTPTDFDIVTGGDSATVETWDVSTDTIRWGKVLSQEAIDTFWIRFVIPGPANAADGDTMEFSVRVRDSLGTGGYDAWPGSTAAGHPVRTVLDTFSTHNLIHLQGDTLWEYGDDQTVSNLLTINSPIMRLKKKVVAQTTGNTFPGDTLIYTIFYDNDGTSETEDTATVIDVLPRGVTFLDTFKNTLDTNPYVTRGAGTKIKTYYRVNTGAWLENIPGTNDSVLQITALKFAIPPGVGLHDTTGEAGSGTKANVLADGDSVDADAGYMTFKVRIR